MFPDERHYAEEIKEEGVGEVCSHTRQKRNVHRSLVGKLKGQRQFGNPVCKWQDDFKMDLKRVD